MKFRKKKGLDPLKEKLPFLIEWIRSDPQKVEGILSKLPLADQARCVMHLTGRQKLDLLLLSRRGKEVVQILSPEEVYFMIKEIGREDTLPLLSAATQDQLQYIFDIDWWQKDKFMPNRALQWLNLLDQINDLEILNWFASEDSDQIVMVLQSLIKVYKKDEMTDSYEDVEGLAHFTPDGDYDIFIRVPEAVAFLKRFLLLLRERQPTHFYALLEAVIWSPVTPTVEKAYHWRAVRIASHGIPEFEEALKIYSRLDPDVLSQSVASPEYFTEPADGIVAPQHLVAQADPSSFFMFCLFLIDDPRRLETIRWELVYLANKVMVADQCDPSNLDHRKEVMQKVLSWIDIGLELGSGGDTQRGIKLLEQTWVQPLFQVGYGQLIKFQWRAQKFLQDYEKFLECLLEDDESNQLSALVAHSIPQRQESKTQTVRHFQSLSEVQEAEIQLQRYEFYIRLTRKALGLTPVKFKAMVDDCILPADMKDCSLTWVVTTAIANRILYKDLSSKPLSDVAAKSFLKMIFLPGVFEDEPRQCIKDLLTIDPFIKTPMAWTPQDREFLQDLLLRCEENLRDHFGRIDLKKPIQWKFTRGLCIRRSNPR